MNRRPYLDPGKPDRMRRVHAQRRADRLQEIDEMVTRGDTIEQICVALGIEHTESLETYLRRHGRPDLTARAKGNTVMGQRMRWKLQAKARLGLPANCNDHEFYRAVALSLKREDIIPNPDARPERARRAKRNRLAAKRRRMHSPDLTAVPAVDEPSEEAA
jgi:hypothetical protein